MRYRPFEDLYSEMLSEQFSSDKFKELLEDSRIDLFEEKYLKYTPPQDKELLMYDFYVLSYLKYLLSQPSKQFRDLPDDIEDSVNDAANTLYPHLRQELLNSLFYSICAEMRHLTANSKNYKLFKEGTPTENKKYRELMIHYLRYIKYQDMKKSDVPETDIMFPENPSSRKRAPEGEKDNTSNRNTSYKAAQYAIKKTNSLPSDFVKMAESAFADGSWFSSYGGNAWARICEGYLRLNRAEKVTSNVSQDTGDGKQKKSKSEDMDVAIDHVYDLQHNTDTVFNKLKTYLKGGSYNWLKRALDHKANVKSYYELLPKTSGTIKSLAPRILYNKLGNTWEQHVKSTTPQQETHKPDTTANVQGNDKLPKIGDILIAPDDKSKIFEILDMEEAMDNDISLKLKNLKTNDTFESAYTLNELLKMGYTSKPATAEPTDKVQVGDTIYAPTSTAFDEPVHIKIKDFIPDFNAYITDITSAATGEEIEYGEELNKYLVDSMVRDGRWKKVNPTVNKPSASSTANSSNEELPEVGDVIDCDGDHYTITKVVPLDDGDYDVFYVDQHGDEDYIDWEAIKGWDCNLQKKNQKKNSPAKVKIGDLLFGKMFGRNVGISILKYVPRKQEYTVDIIDSDTGEDLYSRTGISKKEIEDNLSNGTWKNMGIQI